MKFLESKSSAFCGFDVSLRDFLVFLSRAEAALDCCVDDLTEEAMTPTTSDGTESRKALKVIIFYYYHCCHRYCFAIHHRALNNYRRSIDYCVYDSRIEDIMNAICNTCYSSQISQRIYIWKIYKVVTKVLCLFSIGILLNLYLMLHILGVFHSFPF